MLLFLPGGELSGACFLSAGRRHGSRQDVADWRRSRNVQELQSFVGFVSYYRHFVEGFAWLATPLHLVAELTRTQKGPELLFKHWMKVCEQPFQSLKMSLVTAPVLVYADFKKPFILAIDASYNGLGAPVAPATLFGSHLFTSLSIIGGISLKLPEASFPVQ